ncbi:MAG: trypsin-like peptidase domain-containing protein [Coriobacteriia bacterium]|nr:trypsin-like peptidase domain-containing protein [Coriobacteriia bacterium]
MFQQACEQARKYTCPYVGLRRKHDGTVFSTLGAFMVINGDGWAITAKHVFEEIRRAQNSIAGADGIDQAIAQLSAQKGGNAKHRNREIRKLEGQKRDSLSNHAEIWAAGANWQADKPHATEIRLHPVADLAAFKIEPFVPTSEQAYPVFRSEPITPGLSVCRIGFPWHSVEAEFADNSFDVKSGFPAPLFALDGMISRFAVVEQPDGSKATYIQTSTPGLRGQSGGPVFDVNAQLCGLQSSTTHLDLGFNPTYQVQGKTVVERQFLNVGQAVHVDEISGFLTSHGIAFESA